MKWPDDYLIPGIEPYHIEDAGIIYCGDCREILPHLPKVDLVLTDPPYGVEGGKGGDARDYKKAVYLKKGWEDTEDYILYVVVPQFELILKKVERGAITPGIRCMSFYPRPTDVGCFWTPAAVTHGPWGFTVFQPIYYYGKDFRAGKGALPTGIIVTERSEIKEHPCAKPLKAWKWLVDKISQPNEIILDPFLGSGTTAVAAKELGRRFIGIEIEEKYAAIAVKRLRQGVFDFGGD